MLICPWSIVQQNNNLQNFQHNAFVIIWVLVVRQSDEMQSELPLLLTQDTSATNFMIRDARMQKLVAAEKEPITPFISKVSSWFLLSGNANVRAGIKGKKWCSRTNRAHVDFCSTPLWSCLCSQVRSLFDDFGVSSILVIGGSGDYFQVNSIYDRMIFN